MSTSLKLHWQQLRDKYAALQPREQMLIAAAGAALLLALCDQVLWTPLGRGNTLRANRIAELQTQQQSLAAQRAVISTRLAQNPDADIQASLDAVKARLAQQNEQLQQQTADLIPPEKMAGVLGQVLEKRKTLTLLMLQNESAVPAFKTEVEVGADAAAPALYRHGMTLQLRGRYFEIVAYLDALEKLDWHFYWQELSYKVTTYPEAEVTLKVYTLSDRESWIGA